MATCVTLQKNTALTILQLSTSELEIKIPIIFITQYALTLNKKLSRSWHNVWQMPRRLEWICMLALILLSKTFKSCNGISNCHFQETKSKFGQILNKILRYQNSFPDFLARKKIISFQIQNYFRAKN